MLDIIMILTLIYAIIGILFALFCVGIVILFYLD